MAFTFKNCTNSLFFNQCINLLPSFINGNVNNHVVLSFNKYNIQKSNLLITVLIGNLFDQSFQCPLTLSCNFEVLLKLNPIF